MLDPFSTISLASAIVQFVDFSAKLIAGSVELYRSVDGRSVANVELENIAADIKQLNEGLTYAENQPGAQSRQRSKDEIALGKLAVSCNQINDDLLRVLDAQKAGGPHKKWQSFRKALNTLWDKEKVRELEKRLSRIRDQINSHLLSMMR